MIDFTLPTKIYTKRKDLFFLLGTYTYYATASGSFNWKS